MLDLCLRFEGKGFVPAARTDWLLARDKLHIGQTFRARLVVPRSNKRNDFLHALIQRAYENQRGGPDLPTWQHLKAWLLIEAGHCEETRVKVGRLTLTEAKAAGLAIATTVRLQGREYVGVTYDGKRGEFIIRTAKSVSFHALPDEGQFAEIVDKVVAIIGAEIVPGMTPEEVFAMGEKQAA